MDKKEEIFTQFDYMSFIMQKKYSHAAEILSKDDNTSIKSNNKLLIEYYNQQKFKNFLTIINATDEGGGGQTEEDKSNISENNNQENNIKTEEISLKSNSINPMIILNKLIGNFLCGDYNTAFDNFTLLIKSNPNDFLLLNLGYLILVEIMIKMGQGDYAYQILNKFEKEFTNQTILSQEDMEIDTDILNYLNKIEALICPDNKSNFIIEISTLLGCLIEIENYNYDKAKKKLTDFKSIILSTTEIKKNFPLFLRMKKLYSKLKIKYDYNTGNIPKCIKHLNSFYEKYLSKNPKITSLVNNIDTDDDLSKLFYFNSNGIILLRQSNYSLAKMFFISALNLTEKNFHLKIHYKRQILFNLGLSEFFLRNFKNSYNIFYALENYISRNIYDISLKIFFYYRIGLSLVELLMNEILKPKHNFIDYGSSLDKKRKFILLNGYLPYSFREFVKKYDSSIEDAIFYFKVCLNLIFEFDKYDFNLTLFKQSRTQNITEQFKDYFENKSIKSNLKNSTDSLTELKKIKEENDKSKQTYKEIFQQSYINLLFLLNFLERNTELIFYCENVNSLPLKDSSFVKDPNFQVQIDTYSLSLQLKLLCQCEVMNKWIEGEDPENLQMKKEGFIPQINSIRDTTLYGSFLCGRFLTKELNYKVSMVFNLTLLSIINCHSEMTVEYIQRMIYYLQLKKDDKSMNIPYPLFHIILFYFICNDKMEEAKLLMETKRIPDYFFDFKEINHI
ncbi:MAG: hypothetical protein MJ252_04385 [archaeon]|nr:hypothetical protein [archaeon]